MKTSENRESYAAKWPKDVGLSTWQDRVAMWAETKETKTAADPNGKRSCELPLIFRLL